MSSSQKTHLKSAKVASSIVAKPAMKASRSPCPLACSLDLLGDKWTLLVVRDLFLGKTTYGDFQKGPEGIPTNLLAERLKRLQAAGLVDKKQYQSRPVRYAYSLTDKGRDLGPVLTALLQWGYKHLPDTQVSADVATYLKSLEGI